MPPSLLARIQMHLITKNTGPLLRLLPSPTRILPLPTSSHLTPPPRPTPPPTRPTTLPRPTPPAQPPLPTRTLPAQRTPLMPPTSTAHPHLLILPRPLRHRHRHSQYTPTPRLTMSLPTRLKTPGQYSPIHRLTHVMRAHPSLSQSQDNDIHTHMQMRAPQTSFDNHMHLRLHPQTLAQHIPPMSDRILPSTTPVQYTTTTWMHLVLARRTRSLSPRPLPALLTSKRPLHDTHIPKILGHHNILQRVAPLQEQVRTQTLVHRRIPRPTRAAPRISRVRLRDPGRHMPLLNSTASLLTVLASNGHHIPMCGPPPMLPSPPTTAAPSTSGGRPAYASDPGPVAITAPPPTAAPPARPPAVPHSAMHYPPSHILAYAVAPSAGESHDAGRAAGMPPSPAAHGHAHSHAYGPPQVPSTHPSHSSAPPPHPHPQSHPHLQPPVSGSAHPSSAHPPSSQPPHQQQQQQPPPQTQPPSHPQVAPPSMHPHAPPHPQPQPTVPMVEPPRPAYVSPADTMHSRPTRYVHGHGHSIGSHVPPSGSTHAGQVVDQGLATPQGQAQAYAPPVASVEDRERAERERARERDRERAIREREEQREREREREEQKEREQREREKAREAAEKVREMEMQQQREREEKARDTEKEQVMLEVLEHCKVLYDFACRYAQLQSSSPHVQPAPQELEEMSRRASEVFRLLECLRSPSGLVSSTPTSTTLTGGAGPSSASMDADTRPPKRPWEETQSQQQATHSGSFPSAPAGNISGPSTSAEQTAAEKDMELIRTKRAMTTNLAATAAGGSGGGGSIGGGTPMGSGNSASKNKYRKRSRATPPGKCHSCNIRETPEWRRGPDGARTLCNACGLHYAKLVRKREKAAAEGGGGSGMQIDIDMLRASARAVENDKSRPSGSSSTSGGGNGGASGSDTTGMTAVHTGSFQIMNVTMTSTSDNNPSSSTSTTQTQTSTPTHASSSVQHSSPSHQPRTTASGAPPSQQQQQHQPSQPTTHTHTPQISHTPVPHSAAHAIGLPPSSSHALPSPHGQHSSPHVHHPQVPSQQHGHAHGRVHNPRHATWPTAKGYPPPDMVQQQHPHQSFMRTSHSVSSGASPP
ncbi:hypothetical protein F5J12DRAFT_442276 [Pisolithus orientalis]|uniref:uncharacterized protein n=1 Tax=Pisolithus orientalis TaxID=936130 RepID=UPI00222464E6|nr:uncharacterized protein F5J12DRAFT_442276 [Pisolithus orientalis]KAI6025626.1 hypothetical protein F5J12DRAFT_442276 [Pisolithus orientalis]